VRNILFIMCDQLRADYLGCMGHPHIQTPNIDRLANDGVIFDSAFCQAPVCGGARMSFYTGRYAFSHGAHYNNYPLRVDELTLGDHLHECDMETVLIGKTHMKPDLASLARLGIAVESDIGVHVSQCGFEPYERDDGLHPDEVVDPNLAYNRYLRALGYDSDNPWNEVANAALGADGEILSGWNMRNARFAARVLPEHSETAYMTDRTIEFLSERGAQPWCVHLSYIKPHWPYIAPAPYHEMYGAQDVVPANRSTGERASPHPVVSAFMQHGESVCFAEEDCRNTVIPTYMGLVSEIDHHLGRLFEHMQETGIYDETLIVLTSDHGDYLGDHWLGEKDLFHEESVRIPLIVRDPSAAADASRGTRVASLVEAIDLAPTFVERAGGTPSAHWLEGQSLVPILEGKVGSVRDAAFSDSDYALRGARNTLGLEVDRARIFMVRTERFKLIEYLGFPSQLFDLVDDPGELCDRSGDPGLASVKSELSDRLHEWMMTRKLRVGMPYDVLRAQTDTAHKRGYRFGVW
jgi:arylsulfatase A-like enzyme